MSGSEDGQLRSPLDEQMLRINVQTIPGFSLHSSADDTDSLDIKPPQANVIKETSGSKRKDKSNKDKKHSKERKRKERYSESSVSVKQREKDYQHHQDGRVERRSDGDRRDLRRDDRYQHHQHPQSRQSGGNGYDGDDRGEYEKRYHTKHYDRRGSNNVSGGGSGSSSTYHHHDAYQHQQYQHQHQHAQVNIQRHHRQQQDYYERRPDYHQQPAEYHITRHHHQHQQQQQQQQQSQSYSGSGSNKHNHQDVEMERRGTSNKYSYDHQKDPESLEQDLRSRLLSKRHKYVRDDVAEYYERDVRSYDDHEEQHQRSTSNNERHKSRREKIPKEIIEVFDSPESHRRHSQRKKHKRHKDKHDKRVSSVEHAVSSERFEKRRSPEDPELMVRRAKLLSAEQEKEKRREIARRELEERREMIRERGNNSLTDALSPSAVAASVTAGLHLIKRKAKLEAEEIKRKRLKRHHSDEGNEEGEEEASSSDSSSSDEEDEHEGSAASEESASDSYRNYRKQSIIKTKNYRDRDDTEASYDEGEISLPNSPLSIGELYKSPKQKNFTVAKQRKHAHKSRPSSDCGANEGRRRMHSNSRSRSRSTLTLSPSQSRSRSRSQSRTHDAVRSRSGSSITRGSRSAGTSRSPSLSRSRSRSLSSERSKSRSKSIHSTSRSRSRSLSSRSHTKSLSRSRSRSEERGMHESFRREQNEKHTTIQSEIVNVDADKPVLDAKGKPLPNYYPGIQGCRSVEEFQCLNRIDEGTYGVVYRAKDKRTDEIVALKRLKMEKEKEGFPITSLREINTLLKGQHPNIVTVREIVVGSNMDKIYIVMDYVEHDLKSLMETMKARKQSFLPAEIKCLTQQLLKAVAHLHDNWILHRDLKTSNLLLSHKGILKVGDFGLAREYGSPLKHYTSVVVTLYYRAPELLLCSPEYSTPIDVWSVGCIFGEFLQMAPMFPGKSEVDQLNRFFKVLGTPNEKIWPGYSRLPAVKNMLSQNSQFTEYPVSSLRKYLGDKTSDNGLAFLQGLLTYDPKKRFTAESALKHEYFQELPLPIDPSMFPTWPAKSELGVRRAMAMSPKPPPGGGQAKQLARDELTASGSGSKIISGIITGHKKTSANTGFVLNAGIDQRQLSMGSGFKLKF